LFQLFVARGIGTLLRDGRRQKAERAGLPDLKVPWV
jgi:hypothetical protein